MKKWRSIISQHRKRRHVYSWDGCLNCATLWKWESLHELSRDFSFFKWFTVNETHIFLKSLPKEKHTSHRRGRKVVKVQRADLGFNNCVPLIVFSADGMLSDCWEEFALNISLFKFKSQVKIKVILDRAEIKGCTDYPLLLHCFCYFESPDLSISPPQNRQGIHNTEGGQLTAYSFIGRE